MGKTDAPVFLFLCSPFFYSHFSEFESIRFPYNTNLTTYDLERRGIFSFRKFIWMEYILPLRKKWMRSSQLRSYINHDDLIPFGCGYVCFSSLFFAILIKKNAKSDLLKFVNWWINLRLGALSMWINFIQLKGEQKSNDCWFAFIGISPRNTPCVMSFLLLFLSHSISVQFVQQNQPEQTDNTHVRRSKCQHQSRTVHIYTETKLTLLDVCVSAVHIEWSSECEANVLRRFSHNRRIPYLHWVRACLRAC